MDIDYYIDKSPLPDIDNMVRMVNTNIHSAISTLSTVCNISTSSTPPSPTLDSDADPPNHLILDSGGGCIPTITRKAWYITTTHSSQSSISGYQSTDPPRLCPIVNAITKVHLPE